MTVLNCCIADKRTNLYIICTTQQYNNNNNNNKMRPLMQKQCSIIICGPPGPTAYRYNSYIKKL